MHTTDEIKIRNAICQITLSVIAMNGIPLSVCENNRNVSPGDNRNISCRHHGEQATACTIMQQTTIYHCPQDGFGRGNPSFFMAEIQVEGGNKQKEAL